MKRLVRVIDSRAEVQDSAAVLAAHNFFCGFNSRGGGNRHFHVTAGANAMLDRNDSRIAFALEQALKESEQVLINLSGKRGALFC